MAVHPVVLWDVGGTLVDFALSPTQFLQGCLEPAGIPLASLDPQALQAAETERLRQEVHWRTPEDEAEGCRTYAEAILTGLDVSASQVQSVTMQLGHYFDLYAPVAGIPELLVEVAAGAARPAVQGVVSNWPPSLQAFLSHHRLDTHFRTVMGSGEQGVAKPDARLFELALSELGASPGQCVFIGDNLKNDIEPARALGMRTIHFNPRRNQPQADAYDVDALRQRLLPLLG